jgi:hypothetical protein
VTVAATCPTPTAATCPTPGAMATRTTSTSAPAGEREAGVATVLLPMTVWVATLVAIVVIDLTAYLAAASRSQALADAAALAAVTPDIPGASTRTPRAEAARVVAAGDGHLDDCACVRGAERAAVTVSVAVPGLVLPTLGASRVAADATAVLAPPEDLAPGPTRERSRWWRPADP